MNEQEAKYRIEARRWAEDCYEAIFDKEAFTERVMELAGLAPKPPKELVPMTERECRDFEQEVIFFGTYTNTPINQVPLRYLCRLTDPSERMTAFFTKVKRYLMNPIIKHMIEDEIS